MAPRAPMIRFRIGQLVARYPMLSSEELCRHTQLGDSAVREHLKGLAAAGLVKPVREHRPHLFALEPKCAYVVAVEADREYARATVCDMRLNPCGKPEVLEEPRFRIVNSPATGVNQLARLVKSALEAAPDCSSVIGVGVAMPSPISRRESSPATAHHMPGWESVNVARQLEMKLRTWARLRVIVDNDASVAALACFLHGAFQRPEAPRDLLYVRV